MFDRFARLREIERLDPERDYEQIYRISGGLEFPWDYTRALEIALFRTYCVPSISALLAATGEFERRPQRRYDDTRLLIAEIAEHGFDSARGRAAVRVINRGHGHYKISNDDMRYVLSTFVYEPVRWIDRFGWRPLSEHEKLAAYYFYDELGRRMHITDVPDSYAAFEAFNREYEAKHFHYSADNAAICSYTLGMFSAWFPRPLRPAVRAAAVAILDEPVRRAFGLRAPKRVTERLVTGGLRAHAVAERVLPPRRVSRFVPPKGIARLWRGPIVRSYPGYPDGYEVSELGAGPPPAGLDPRWRR